MTLNGYGIAGFFAGIFLVILIEGIFNTNPPPYGPVLMGVMVGYIANAFGDT